MKVFHIIFITLLFAIHIYSLDYLKLIFVYHVSFIFFHVAIQ